MTDTTMGDAPSGQTWDAERYARNARFVTDLGAPLVDLLAPRAGERILDLGCGDGALAAEIASAGVEVVGVDAAPDMIDAACKRGLDARLMDGAALTFDREFDAVLSNAALHWMTEPGRVLDGVRRALRPGGRFIAEFGGDGNVAEVRRAYSTALERRGIDAEARSPWYFPTAEAYRAKLGEHGFRVDSIALFPRPTPIPGDLGDWLDTFTESFLAAVPEEERAALKGEVVEAARPALCDGEGRWTVDYVRLRVAARL